MTTPLYNPGLNLNCWVCSYNGDYMYGILSCPDENGQATYPWQVKKWVTYDDWLSAGLTFIGIPEDKKIDNPFIALPWRTADGKVTIIK